MKDAIVTIAISRPEGYEDVCDDLLIADFFENPKAFTVTKMVFGTDAERSQQARGKE